MGDRRGTAWLAVALLLTLGAVGCTRSEADSLDRESWLRDTRALFEQEIQGGEGAPWVVLPSYGWDDVYTMALAVIGLGERAGEVAERVGSERVPGAFEDVLASGDLEQTAGDELYTAAVYLEADEALPFLSDSDRDQLREVVDGVLRGAEELDVVDAVVLGDLAAGLDHRTGDVAELGRGVGERAGTGLCPSEEGDFPFTIAAALPGHDLEETCGRDALAAAWDERAQELSAATESMGPDDVATACMDGYWLARSARELGLEDDTRARSLADSLSVVVGLLESNQVPDPIHCARDVQRTARVLGLQVDVPAPVVPYLQFVLETGAEPVVAELDPDDGAAFLRTAAILGADPSLPDGALDGVEPLDLLRVRAAQEPGWTDEIARLTDEVARTADDVAAAAVVVAPAMLSGGEDACESTAGLHLLESLVSDSAAQPHSPDTPRVAVAQASRVLGACDRAARASTDQVLADWATETLADDDEEAEADLVEGWEAAAMLCALEPSALPSPDARWDRYGAHAVDIGGASHSDRGISVEATRMLVELATADEANCASTGQLGDAGS